MSAETIAAIAAVAILALLTWLAFREALSVRARERFVAVALGIGDAVAAVHRFFVTPRSKTDEKEVPDVSAQ